MLLEEMFRNKETSFCHMERYINKGSPSGFSKYTTSKKTNPKSCVKVLTCPIVNFENYDNIFEFGINKYLELDQGEIVIHPDMISLIDDQLIKYTIKDSIRTSPTASGRTVKMLDQNGDFIKLAYKNNLGRTPRNIGKQEILSGVEITSILKKIINSNKTYHKFAFLPENYGKLISFKDDILNNSWGMVLRDSIPYPTVKYNEIMIPFFSLFAKDERKQEDPSILFQLFKNQKKSMEEFLISDILLPLCFSYFSVLTESGLALEAHAQNMLISIDEDFKINRIIARDLESVDKDISLIQYYNYDYKFLSYPYKCIEKGGYSYQILRSFMYDFKLGEYIITPLIEHAKNLVEIDQYEICKKIKQEVSLYINKLPNDYFSEEWYDYPNEIFDLNTPRPYRRHLNPKYR